MMETTEIFTEAIQLASALTEKDIEKDLDNWDCFMAAARSSSLFDDFETIPGPEIEFKYSPSNVLLFLIVLLMNRHENESKCLAYFIKIIDARLIVFDRNMDNDTFKKVVISIFHEQYTFFTED